MWDYSNLTEVTIDRPASVVWPYLFRPKADIWSKTAYTTVAGEPGKVGETYAMPYQGGELLFEAITVQPEKRLVLKILHKESSKAQSNLAGYDLIRLSEVAGRTTVTLQQVFALPVEPDTERHDDFLAEIFQDLKTMVENG
jgi:hypothetical protein